jgi:hypothetical protein
MHLDGVYVRVRVLATSIGMGYKFGATHVQIEQGADSRDRGNSSDASDMYYVICDYD